MRLTEWKEVADCDGELRFYRDRTVALLRKYFLMSVELGHLPSLFGREFFRSNVSSYATHTFEDTAIFVHDMERTLAKLSAEAQVIIARLVFQDYSWEEAAELIGISRRGVRRKFADSIDSCTRALLDRGMLDRFSQPESAGETTAPARQQELPPKMPIATASIGDLAVLPKCCQGGKTGEIRAIR